MFAQTNTLPAAGNVGIGTTSPSALLDVNGNMVVDSSVVIKDSLNVQKKLIVDQDIKVKGEAVFVGEAKFKDKLVVDGLTKLNGDLKIKSLENTTISTNRLLSVAPNGKIVISSLTVPQDDTFVCGLITPWANADNSLTDVVLCPNFNNVGIGTTVPLAKLHVSNGNTILNTRVGIGVPNSNLINNPTDPQLLINVLPSYNRMAVKIATASDKSIYFVPRLNTGGFSTMSVQEDFGMFWSDNAGNNNNSGFVIAPQSGSNIGMRISSAGQYGFNTAVNTSVQYNMYSNSTVGLQLATPLLNGTCYGISTIVNNSNDVAYSVKQAISITPNSPDVYRVMGNGSVKIRIDNDISQVPSQAIVVEDINNLNELTNDVFRVMSNGNVYATRVRVLETQNFPDYVFKPNYELMSLPKLENYITTNKHLPNMPTAKEVAEQGADLGELNRLLVEKVEELTLYMIQMNKEIEQLKKENQSLQQSVTSSVSTKEKSIEK